MLGTAKLGAAAMAAGLGIAFPVGAAALEGDAPQTSWQLRAQVRVGSAAGLSSARPLAEGLDAMRRAACRQARDLLWDGQPRRGVVQLTLWRQAGPLEPSGAPVRGVDCHLELAGRTGFRLAARVPSPKESSNHAAGGSLGRAVRRAGELANDLGPRVLLTGEQAWVTIRARAVEKGPRRIIRALAGRYRVDVGRALRVADCESRFDPKAYNYPYAGIYQQNLLLWPRRASRYGHAGASPFDPYANIDVSLKMVRASGWGHWGCA